jgi:integrase
VLLAIETGLRWGELIALRPADIDFTTRIITVRRVIVEVAKKNSPTGQRCFVKDYPKDDEQGRISIDTTTIKLLREHMLAYNVRNTELLFTSTAGTALSRNNFRTKHWAPAVKAATLDQKVTFHNLRAADASARRSAAVNSEQTLIPIPSLDGRLTSQMDRNTGGPDIDWCQVFKSAKN